MGDDLVYVYWYDFVGSALGSWCCDGVVGLGWGRHGGGG